MNIDFEMLGKDKVVISLEDFEDMMDVIAFDDAIARNEETFPVELATKMIAGESPMKVFREYRGYTQSELADKVKMSQPTIAALENGKKEGSIKTLKKLALALDVDIDDLV